MFAPDRCHLLPVVSLTEEEEEEEEEEDFGDFQDSQAINTTTTATTMRMPLWIEKLRIFLVNFSCSRFEEDDENDENADR